MRHCRRVLYVLLRGPRVATLPRLILQPHKQMRGHAARARLPRPPLHPDPNLRAFQVVQQERCRVLAVRVVLADGGRSEVRTAKGVVLALGAR